MNSSIHMDRKFIEKDFNLIRYVTKDRDKGIIVWLCNIGAEKYWNKTGSGIVDINEDIPVNRIEEMNLLICREQDIIILRKMPDQKYLSDLKGLGFSIPSILTPENADLLIPVSELVVKDEKLLQRLKEIASGNQNVYFVPYAVTYLEEEIAEKAGLRLMGAPSHVNARINDKIFNREVSEKLGFNVCKGKICGSVDEIRQEYEELTGSKPFFEKVIVKEPNGASGKGLYIIENRDKLEPGLRMIARFSRGRTNPKWLVEGWYNKKLDINYQIYVSPGGEVEVFSVKQQLLRDTVYIGSVLPPDIEADIMDSYMEYGRKVGKYLFEMGFTGVAGIDSIITDRDEIIPIIEINGRFTLSTYISFLEQNLGGKKILSRYFRLLPDNAVGYEDICRALDREGILIEPGQKEGVLVYTAGTLPYRLNEGSDYYVGRVFVLVVSDSREKINEYNLKLEKVIHSFSRV